MRDQAAHACRALCRARVAEVLQRRRGTRIGEHLKLVISIIDRQERRACSSTLPAAPGARTASRVSPQGTSRRFPDYMFAGPVSVADMTGKRRPARKWEAQYSPHEETAKHHDLPKLFGQELQSHFKPLQDLPHRMFTLLTRLKNIRAPQKWRRAASGGAQRSRCRGPSGPLPSGSAGRFQAVTRAATRFREVAAALLPASG